MVFCTESLNYGQERFQAHAAVPVGDKVYNFGGFHIGQTHDTDQMEVQVLNTVSLCWMTLPPVTTGTGERLSEVPSKHWGHTAVLIEDTVYIWGGVLNAKTTAIDNQVEVTGNYWDNTLYAFDVTTHRWHVPKIHGTVPLGKWFHSACVLRKAMYIHGGFNPSTQYTNNICKLDTTTMVWSLIDAGGNPPPASWYHSATIIGTQMFVFGGRKYQEDYHNYIRVFDTETNSWLRTPPAQLCPRQLGRHAAFAYNGEVYIVGSFASGLSRRFNDVWKFIPETFSWKMIEAKGNSPDRLCNFCCCRVEDRVFLFGYTQAQSTLQIVHLISPSLKILCKLAVVKYGLEQSGLPHNIRWELAHKR